MSFSMYSSSKADYGEHDHALKQYQEQGTKKALAMSNRGPVRYDSAGRLDQSIVNAVSYTHLTLPTSDLV